MLNKEPPKWVTSWPDWLGIPGNVTVIPFDYYEKKQSELIARIEQVAGLSADLRHIRAENQRLIEIVRKLMEADK